MINPPIKLAWWKRALRFLLFAVVVWVTLVVLVASWTSLQGRREWNETKKELLARGEKLSLVELAPPPVLDNENFFADSIWTEMEMRRVENPQLALLKAKPNAEESAVLQQRFPVFAGVSFDDSRILIALHELNRVALSGNEAERKEFPLFTQALLEPLAPLLTKVSDLRRRPKARFPVEYAKGFSANVRHAIALLSLSQGFFVRARSAMFLRDEPAAFRNTLTVIKLSRTVSTEPMLISQMVRISILGLAIDAIQIGIKEHLWTAEDLVIFARELGEEDLMADLPLAFRGERGGVNLFMEWIRTTDEPIYGLLKSTAGLKSEGENKESWGQQAWRNFNARLYLTIHGAEDQAFYNIFFQKIIEKIEAAKSTGLSSDIELPFEDVRNAALTAHQHLVSGLALPAIGPAIKKFPAIQDQIVQAQMACALERYYLAYQEYPASLDALVPKYFSSLPMDVVTLQPMYYERTAADKFSLWSIGWDGKNDHGRIPVSRSSDDGDWVWGEDIARVIKPTP